MFLALTALMFQFSVSPQPLALSGATVAAAAAVTASAPSMENMAAPTMNSEAASTSAMETPASDELPLDAEPQPAPPVAYAPGRLTPEPVAPAASAPAEPGAIRAIRQQPVLAPADDHNRRRLWLGLSIAQHSAATFDAWSTRRVIASGAGQELNPMLRPFAGNASLYLAVQVAPAVLDYVSHRMMYSEHAWARRTWWVPQTLGTVVSFASGVHNLGVYNAR